MKKPAISVIIPTLNEATRLPGLLRSLVGQRWLHEIIVSDGGSKDNTHEICRRYPVKWVSPGKGKSRQLNAGAAHASGNILLFLHADSELPAGAFDSIPAILENDYVAGSFRMGFDDTSVLLRFYSFFTRINSSVFTYGDQGLFINREVFNQIGGYPECPFLEDIKMVKRLRKIGRMGKSDVEIKTSARRFRETGPVVQQVRNILIVSLFYLGIPPERLIKFYPYK